MQIISNDLIDYENWKFEPGTLYLHLMLLYNFERNGQENCGEDKGGGHKRMV